MARVMVFAVILAYAVCPCARAAQEAVERGIERYNRALADGNGAALSDSERSFAEHLEAGFDNAAIRYNLGVLALRQGHVGRAIAEFERARRFAPRSERILQALELARLRVSAPAKGDSAPRFLPVLLSWHTDLTVRESGWAFVVFWVVACALVASARAWRSRVLLVAGCMALVCALALGGSLAWKTCWTRQTAVVTVADAAARSGAGAHFPETYRLPDGTECRVLEARPGWLRVRVSPTDAAWLADTECTVY